MTTTLMWSFSLLEGLLASCLGRSLGGGAEDLPHGDGCGMRLGCEVVGLSGFRTADTSAQCEEVWGTRSVLQAGVAEQRVRAETYMLDEEEKREAGAERARGRGFMVGLGVLPGVIALPRGNASTDFFFTLPEPVTQT